MKKVRIAAMVLAVIMAVPTIATTANHTAKATANFTSANEASFIADFPADDLIDEIEKIHAAEDTALDDVNGDIRKIDFVDIVRDVTDSNFSCEATDEGFQIGGNGDVWLTYKPAEVYNGGLFTTHASYIFGNGVSMFLDNGTLHFATNEGSAGSHAYDRNDDVQRMYYTLNICENKIATEAELAMLALAVNYGFEELAIPTVGEPPLPPENADAAAEVSSRVSEMISVNFDKHLAEVNNAYSALLDAGMDVRDLNQLSILDGMGLESVWEDSTESTCYYIDSIDTLVQVNEQKQLGAELSYASIYVRRNDEQILKLYMDRTGDVMLVSPAISHTRVKANNYYAVKSAYGGDSRQYDNVTMALLLCVMDGITL